MKLDLEMEVLAMTCDDFESSGTLTGDLRWDFGAQITEDDVRAAFNALLSKNLVESYRYNVESQQYVPVRFSGIEQADTAWFYATKAGKELVR